MKLEPEVGIVLPIPPYQLNSNSQTKTIYLFIIYNFLKLNDLFYLFHKYNKHVHIELIFNFCKQFNHKIDFPLSNKLFHIME